MRFINIKKTRFGRLTVLGRGPNDKWGNAKWRVKCDCGKRTIVWGSNLRGGGVISCGCWRKECRTTHGHCKNYKTTHSYDLWKHAKHRARELHLPFNISPNDIIIPKTCPALGISLSWYNKLKEDTPSVDRIKPDLGYVKGNIWVISYRANRLQNNASLEEMTKIVAGARKALRMFKCL